MLDLVGKSEVNVLCCDGILLSQQQVRHWRYGITVHPKGPDVSFGALVSFLSDGQAKFKGVTYQGIPGYGRRR